MDIKINMKIFAMCNYILSISVIVFRYQLILLDFQPLTMFRLL